MTGDLPQVSWVVAPVQIGIIALRAPLFGEITLSSMIGALTSNAAQWAKTALFLTYDENGGFFDHVTPVTAYPGYPGEVCRRRSCRSDPTTAGSGDGAG